MNKSSINPYGWVDDEYKHIEQDFLCYSYQELKNEFHRQESLADTCRLVGEIFGERNTPRVGYLISQAENRASWLKYHLEKLEDQEGEPPADFDDVVMELEEHEALHIEMDARDAFTLLLILNFILKGEPIPPLSQHTEESLKSAYRDVSHLFFLKSSNVLSFLKNPNRESHFPDPPDF